MPPTDLHPDVLNGLISMLEAQVSGDGMTTVVTGKSGSAGDVRSIGDGGGGGSEGSGHGSGSGIALDTSAVYGCQLPPPPAPTQQQH